MILYSHSDKVDQEWLAKMRDRWGAFLTERLRKKLYLFRAWEIAQLLQQALQEENPGIENLPDTFIMRTANSVGEWYDVAESRLLTHREYHERLKERYGGDVQGGDVAVLVISPDFEIVPEGTMIPVVRAVVRLTPEPD